MNCTITYTAADGSPSLLHPELEKAFGAQAAIGLFRQVATAQAAGRFASRTPRANGEPTLAQVQELLKNGSLDPPTAAMVNADRLDEITARIAVIIPRLQARLDGYLKGDPGLSAKDKSVKELKQVIERLNDHDQLNAYVELVKYADRTLRESDQFLRHVFNAEAAAAHENKHIAALAEIATQMKTFADIVSPSLANDNTTLRRMLVGDATAGTVGLQRQREDVAALVEKRTLELLTKTVSLHANREGLTDEQLIDRIQKSGDIEWYTKAFGGASGSSDKLIATLYTLSAQARLEADRKSKQDEEHIYEEGRLFAAATGGNDFGYMAKLDAAGKTTMRYVTRISDGFYEAKRKLSQAVSEAGDYLHGTGLNAEQKAQNIAVWQAKQAKRAWEQAEHISDTGEVTDGKNVRYTQEFKDIRAQYQVLRQDGSYWSWGRKSDLLGFATQEEADENYDRFLAKYYGEKSMRAVMLKTTNANGLRVPTGELTEREMQFTNSKATTEVVEENWRDAQYQRMMADTSKAGVAKLRFYNFFIDNLGAYAKMLPAEDANHLLQGNLPAIMAATAGRYNNKGAGFLDWAGKLVSNPLQSMKDLVPAIKAGRDGIRTKEDGTLLMDVAKKFTGGFKDQRKIQRLENKLGALELQYPDKSDKDYLAAKKKLQTALTIEHNRVEAAEGEMNLPLLLVSFGRMARNYQELKQEEGTVKLIQHAISHREYYYEDGEGNFKLGSDGKPVVRENYDSQASRFVADWLAQNYYEDLRLHEGNAAQYAAMFQRISSLTVQGLNIPAAIKNFTVGTLSNKTIAAAEKFGMTKKAMNKALGIIGADTYNIAADRLADFVDQQTYVLRPRTSKVDAFIHEYDFLQHGHGVDEMRTGSVLDKLYVGISVGEYGIQSAVAITKANTKILTGADGKQKSFWDAHQLVNGKLVVDPNFKEAVAKSRHRLVLDTRNANKNISGNYAEDDKVGLQRHYLGRLLLQYHKYAYEGFKRHWGRQQFDEGVGEVTKGYYRSLSNLWKAIDGLRLKVANYHNLSDLDKANLKVVLKEMEYAAGLLALMLLAGYLKPEPDDEDKHWLFVSANFAERVLSGSRAEMTGYINPIDLYSNAKNPVAGMSYVRDIAVFTQRVMEVPAYGLTGNSEKLFYETGTLKGESKALKAGMDLVPVLRMKRVYDALQTTGQPWIR